MLTHKDFMVASLLPYTDFAADGDDSPCIEYIILAKKGTCAYDFRNRECDEIQQALVFLPNTSFRLVKAYFENRAVFHGVPGSWKIYLETIPEKDKPGALSQEDDE